MVFRRTIFQYINSSIQQPSANDEKARPPLESLIMAPWEDKLEIPDAGEFRMDGSGTLYLADNLVKAKYSSILKGITDYDEDTDAVTYSEEEHDSGDKVLFMV